MVILPDAFIQRFKEILPQIDPKQAFAPKMFVSFRVNTLKTNIKNCLLWFKENSIIVEQWQEYEPALIVKADDASLVKASTLISSGELYPQGLQSMIPVLVLDPKPGEYVLDLCAAPGSKTSQIAAHMENQGNLTANEIIRDRFYKLKAVMEIMGGTAKLTMLDGRRIQAHAQLFDKILVDAPCSSEGRFNLDNPKSIGYWSVRKIHEAAHKQKGLLMNAVRLLKPGGTLVYSTCTFAPEENEAVVDWILRKEPLLSIQEINLKETSTYPSVMHWHDRDFDSQVSKCVRILPDAKLEGFFIAKFIKSHYK